MSAPAVVSAMVRVNWGLLGEWWCARADASEEECLDAFVLQATCPVTDRELMRDRLFGGYPCAEDPARRHVYFAAGAYTYINPAANERMSEEKRREWWVRIIEENGEPGNGPFTHAGPTR